MAFKLLAPVADLKTDLLVKIDKCVSKVRLKYITDLPGQQAVYDAKLAEAETFLTGGKLPSFPWLEQEVKATGNTMEQVAVKIVTAADICKQANIAIEGARQTAKVAIASAKTAADLYQIGKELESAMKNL
jgi:hypothetical protein